MPQPTVPASPPWLHPLPGRAFRAGGPERQEVQVVRDMGGAGRHRGGPRRGGVLAGAGADGGARRLCRRVRRRVARAGRGREGAARRERPGRAGAVSARSGARHQVQRLGLHRQPLWREPQAAAPVPHHGAHDRRDAGGAHPRQRAAPAERAAGAPHRAQHRRRPERHAPRVRAPRSQARQHLAGRGRQGQDCGHGPGAQVCGSAEDRASDDQRRGHLHLHGAGADRRRSQR
mmetsp:Transcript_47703/g.119444  ORF Transcript_47703/g.119444 Transcript_47703/m.119444 type:complete len:232 (+) Transcript_47703:142-837(+)